MEIETEERLLDTLRLAVPTVKCLLQIKVCYGPVTDEHVRDAEEMQGAELAVFVTHIMDLAEPFADSCALCAISGIRELVPRYLAAANVLADEYLATVEAYKGYVGADRRV
jgi:hypothetical protein